MFAKKVEEGEEGEDGPLTIKASEFEYKPLVYKPLADTPGLFLEFARLADREIDEETWLAWVHRYGDLGRVGYYSHPKRLGGGIVAQPDDHIHRFERLDCHDKESSQIRLDTLGGFRWFAWLANYTLRLYELATAPYGADVEAIAETLFDDSEVCGDGLMLKIALEEGNADADRARQSALGACWRHVQRELQVGAFPRVVFKEPDKPTHGMITSWGFHTLLGAMFVQMMWLMTATEGVRRCSGPGCSVVVYFETPDPEKAKTSGNGMPSRKRKDARFCSARCKQAHWRHKQSTRGR